MRGSPGGLRGAGVFKTRRAARTVDCYGPTGVATPWNVLLVAAAGSLTGGFIRFRSHRRGSCYR